MGASGSSELSEDQIMIRDLSNNLAYNAAKEAIMFGKKGAHSHVEYVNRCESNYRKRILREKHIADEWVIV